MSPRNRRARHSASRSGRQRPPGDLRRDGITGAGGCDPHSILPFNMLFTFDWTGVTEPADGGARLTLHWQGSVLIESFTVESPPCSVKGATSVLNGRIQYDSPDGANLVIEPKDLRLDVTLQDPLPERSCLPQTSVVTMNGTVRLEDTYAGSTQLADVTLKELRSAFSPLTGQLDVEGSVQGACFAGVTHVISTERIDAPFGMGCFDAGHLGIDGAKEADALVFGPGGTLDVESGGTTETYASCAERPAAVCGGP